MQYPKHTWSSSLTISRPASALSWGCSSCCQYPPPPSVVSVSAFLMENSVITTGRVIFMCNVYYVSCIRSNLHEILELCWDILADCRCHIWQLAAISRKFWPVCSLLCPWKFIYHISGIRNRSELLPSQAYLPTTELRHVRRGFGGQCGSRGR